MKLKYAFIVILVGLLSYLTFTMITAGISASVTKRLQTRQNYAQLSVQIQDSAGNILNTSQVRILSQDTLKSVTSSTQDTTGSHTFSLAPGDYTVTALSDGYTTDTQNVHFDAAQTATLTFKLEK